jgi:hypothetical protein
MPNQPVQIVLNPRQLAAPRERTGGGSGKDFFAGRDKAFVAHRSTVSASLQDVSGALRASGSANALGFLVVQMRADALAKSHRPQDALFKRGLSPHTATEKIGQPIFAVTPEVLDAVRIAVDSAEDTPEVREDSEGVSAPRPSNRRTETSAIASVRLWGEADKRHFSAAEAVEWLGTSSFGPNQYQVELFSTYGAADTPVSDAWRLELRRLVEALQGLGVIATRARIPMRSRSGIRLTLGVFDMPGTSQLQIRPVSDDIERTPITAEYPVTLDAVRHQDVLDVLTSSPVVRSIDLIPKLSAADSATVVSGTSAPSDIFDATDGPSPKVGVIDCGIDGPITSWVAGDRNYVAPADRDPSHGTFIAGLLVAAGDLNTYFGDYRRGCTLYDVAVLPSDPGRTGIPFDNYYPDGIPGFMDEVESAVEHLSQTEGVRVFTFSMNVESAPGQAEYSYMAQRLDAIADRLNVIFVISAGNLEGSESRNEWAPDIQTALADLASDRRGFLAQPGESLYNASVSALNPPGFENQVPFALARYSRRGPGLRGAVKPDFAHVGGTGSPGADGGTGLFSIDTSGQIVSDAGTSYSGPLVARRIAELDSEIESTVTRETLLALTVHNATSPAHLQAKGLLRVARDIIGYGIPSAPGRVLEADDSGITIVVQTTLLPGQEHKLEFAWPASLVHDGRCRGYARITLVTRPVLAYQHGQERVRVNLDAKLMQQQADGKFKGKLSSIFVADSPPKDQPKNERDLLIESMKWQVVKSMHVKMPKGHGPTSRWKLLVEYLARAGETFPDAGVEYALVLDIKDLDKAAPVFQEMRAQLGTLNVQTSDIRTRAQARAQAQ